MSLLFYFRKAICLLKGKPIPYRTIRCEEKPDDPKPKSFYVLGSVNDWGLVFVCPCGCAEVIELNLLEQVRPRWQIDQVWDSTISVAPSVWRKVGCRSHFWIRSGVIVWVRN